MKTPRRLPQQLSGRPFTVAEAAHAGVSKGRLRHRSLRPLGRGIRGQGTTAALTLGARVRPFVEVNEQCAASHATAAELHGLPTRKRGLGEDEVFHVIRPEGAAHLKRPHVVVHRAKLLPGETMLVGGIPVTSPARTWLDLAERITLDELVAVGDACVRIPYPELEGREEPHCTVGDLRDIVARHRGKRGIRKARLALALIRVGSDSPQETALRLALLRAGLPEPVLNARIVGKRGQHGPKPDIGYPEYGVGVEYEGEHHGTEPQIVRDIARSESYDDVGWAEVRISKRHMANEGKAAVAKVRTALFLRGWRPGQASTRASTPSSTAP
ncbi:hypothetical protein [Sinomonas flava]|uniref:AbiEi antitoxin C-terminal domain-containing protein n=1 Tax=Sinomonas flava TaxID=496857 RepID=A0ABP5NQJ9_9MICC